MSIDGERGRSYGRRSSPVVESLLGEYESLTHGDATCLVSTSVKLRQSTAPSAPPSSSWTNNQTPHPMPNVHEFLYEFPDRESFQSPSFGSSYPLSPLSPLIVDETDTMGNVRPHKSDTSSHKREKHGSGHPVLKSPKLSDHCSDHYSCSIEKTAPINANKSVIPHEHEESLLSNNFSLNAYFPNNYNKSYNHPHDYVHDSGINLSSSFEYGMFQENDKSKCKDVYNDDDGNGENDGGNMYNSKSSAIKIGPNDLNKQSTPKVKYHVNDSNDANIDESALSLPKSAYLLKNLMRSETVATATTIDIGNVIPSIPTEAEKAQYRRSFDNSTNLVFHQRTGLPLTSSPAPMRKSGTCFDFDSSLTSVNAIKKALFDKEPEPENEYLQKSYLSTSAPPSTTISSLLGSFEESVLNGRLEPVSTVQGFTIEIGASGSFCPRHLTLPVTVFFYSVQDSDKVSSPYLGHISLSKKGYHIPRKGTVQVTLFNPHGTVVKMFVVLYDLTDMPTNSRTFLRHRTLYMPSDANENDPDSRKWLRYLIHLRFVSSKSNRIYLHTDIRIIVFRKHDLDVAINGQSPYELRSFTQWPLNPKYS